MAIQESCPHCGASQPVTLDAYCAECHNPLDEPEPTFHAPPERRWMFPMNQAAFVVIVAAFGPAVLIGELVGDDRSALRLALGGPLALVIDIVYRLRSSWREVFRPEGGGKFLYLPIWMFGVFWTVYGILQLRE